MAALQKIRNAGFTVSMVGDSFQITPASALTQDQRVFLKAHRAEIIDELRVETFGLSATDRQKLLVYMEAIDERSPEMIDELLTKCSKDPYKLAWALQWADKVLTEQTRPELRAITCGGCQHFRSYYDHGGGAGNCAVGVPSPGICWWSQTPHHCEKYQALMVKK